MRLCPVCKILLETVSLEGNNIEVCLTCKGMFFEFDEMKTVLKNTLQEKYTEIFEGDNASDHTAPYTCPKCEENMREEEYGFNSGIHIDRCDNCMSIFLNGGEAKEINRYLSSMESEEVQELELAKIETEYDEKYKDSIRKIFFRMQQDELL